MEFDLNYPPPNISERTIERTPYMLLRQVADNENTYDIQYIISEIIANNNNFNDRFIIEVAQNKMLKDQLTRTGCFDKWIAEAKKITIINE